MVKGKVPLKGRRYRLDAIRSAICMAIRFFSGEAKAS